MIKKAKGINFVVDKDCLIILDENDEFYAIPDKNCATIFMLLSDKSITKNELFDKIQNTCSMEDFNDCIETLICNKFLEIKDE